MFATPVVSGREPNDSYAIEVVNPKSGKTNVIRAAGRDLRVRHDFLATQSRSRRGAHPASWFEGSARDRQDAAQDESR